MISPDRPSCEECENAFRPCRWDTPEEAEKKEAGPDCWACRPELLQDNEEAFEIYNLCSGQWIPGAGGVVDLNLGTVLQVMDTFEVQDKKNCLLKVRTIAGIQLKKWREEEEARRNADTGNLY